MSHSPRDNTKRIVSHNSRAYRLCEGLTARQPVVSAYYRAVRRFCPRGARVGVETGALTTSTFNINFP